MSMECLTHSEIPSQKSSYNLFTKFIISEDARELHLWKSPQGLSTFDMRIVKEEVKQFQSK